MSRVTYNVPQPIQPPDGNPVYVKAQIERAPNVAGTPGVFANIATVVGSTTGKWFYRYEDDGAAATLDDWYRHRYTDLAVALFSDYSVEVQVDEYLAMLWALADITDADITIDEVVQWANQGIIDLWPEFWTYYPANAADRILCTITPDDLLVVGTLDEYYDIPSDLHEIARIEKIDATNQRHKDWMFYGTQWEQIDRQVRIFELNSAVKYRMHGKRRLRDISELGEEFHQLVYWMIRKQYLDWRVNKRADTPRRLVFDRKNDTTPEQLETFLKRAIYEVDLRMAKLRPQDFTYDIAPGMAV